MSLALLTGPGYGRAEPGPAAACRRWQHAALRARATSTVPSGIAPPAMAQERE
jgi:hypothetical protein